MSDNRYDYSISLIRVIAMTFIVICHLGNYFGKNVVAQFFNVGVHIFFLISGYLYGDKEIRKPSEWMFKRYLRLAVPAYLWLLIIVLSDIIRQQPLPEIHEVVFLVLNLQGLNFIFAAMKDLFIGPWFFTNIMCCYILFLVYSKVRQKGVNVDKLFMGGGVIPLLGFIVLACLRISTDGALLFFIGLNIKKKKLLETSNRKTILIAGACFAVSVAIRLLGKRLLDATVVYDEIISPLTHAGIACAVLVGVTWAYGSFPKAMNYIAKSTAVRYLDRASIYIYVFHPMFFNGTICDMFNIGISTVPALLLYLVCVVAFAMCGMYVGEFLTKKIETMVFRTGLI